MLNIVTKEMSEVIVTNNKLLTIRDLIHDYFTNYNSPLPSSSGFTMWSEMNEIKYYYNENLKGISGCYPIEEIVRMCVRGLYTTGHQKRVPVTAINDAVNKLVNNKFIDYFTGGKRSLLNKNKFYQKFIDFEELYETVKQLIGNTKGIGLVTIYDTARRIGHLLPEPIYPTAYVYLHYNKVNSAARSILNKKLKYREPTLSFLCTFCNMFPSISIEDFLCVYAHVFISDVRTKQDEDETVTYYKRRQWRKIKLSDFTAEEEKRREKVCIPKRWPEFSNR